jgi:hypothetical protein
VNRGGFWHEVSAATGKRLTQPVSFVERSLHDRRRPIITVKPEELRPPDRPPSSR